MYKQILNSQAFKDASFYLTAMAGAAVSETSNIYTGLQSVFVLFTITYTGVKIYSEVLKIKKGNHGQPNE